MDAELFQKMVHVQSGKEFDMGFLKECTYVETLGMDGPKLMMSWDDPNSYLTDELRVRELDEVEVQIADTWTRSGIDVTMPFKVLTAPKSGSFVKYNLMASPVYQTKQIADKTKLFNRRGTSEILDYYVPGVKKSVGSFPVVENYHCIAGERPSIMLRQMAREQGALVWLCRDTMSFQAMDSLMQKAPAFEYHYGKPSEDFQIISYVTPSQKNPIQENVARGFAGWNDVTGRVKAPSSGAVLSKAGKYATSINSSQHIYTLGNNPTAYNIAIDFHCAGNGFLTSGLALKLWWHHQNPESPLDESLPEKVVIHTVAHHYSAQKYFCRVLGAVPFEPDN